MKATVLIAGLGSIGKRHLKNLRHLYPDMKIIVLRRKESMPVEEQALADEVVTQVEDALSYHPLAAVICTPAPFHVPLAAVLAEKGVHLLIEKPLSHSSENIEALIDRCNTNELVLHTAYPFRFYPLIEKLKEVVAMKKAGEVVSVLAECGQYLPDWRVGKDYRQGVSARNELGGGALLELSHEFDYLRYIFGEAKSLNARCYNSGALEIDVEDVADIVIGFESGMQANVHLDFLQRVAYRQCKVICTEGTLRADFMLHKLVLETTQNKEPEILYANESYDTNAMFIAQMEHFFANVNSGGRSRASGWDGLQAVRMVEAAKLSSRAGCQQMLDNKEGSHG